LIANPAVTVKGQQRGLRNPRPMHASSRIFLSGDTFSKEITPCIEM
jgi:hypothetical protein